MNCKFNMQMSGKKAPCIFFQFSQVHFLSFESGNYHMLPIFCSASKRLQEGVYAHPKFLTRCLIQMGRQLNGHNVDLWSLVGYLGTFGAQLFIQQHTKGGEQVHCNFQFESQICRCKCELIWGIKSKKPHII